MKKIFTILIILLTISSAVFADGITGIFGIEFGKSSTEVKSAMEEKGWKLSKTDDSTFCYKKSKGTYANLIVDEILLHFYEDKFYKAVITFPYSTKLEDGIAAVKAIQESYELTLVNQASTKESGIDILLYSYADPKMNMFELLLMGSKSFDISWFVLTDWSINADKKADDDKKKKEETQRKNKSISSDL